MDRRGWRRLRKIIRMRERWSTRVQKSFSTTSMKSPHARFDAAGGTALIVGATGIGLAPLLVRLSETGPVATAFYRLALAQPIIWLLLKREGAPSAEKKIQRSDLWYAALAGLLF